MHVVSFKSKCCARLCVFLFILLIFNTSFSPAAGFIEDGGWDEGIQQRAGDRQEYKRMEPPAVRSQAGPAAAGKSKALLYILGGAVVVGGVAAYLLLSGGEKTGSIQIVSNPPGAKVILDGTDTGMLTDCTITEVDEGSHTVRLIKDGYVEAERTVSVAKKETTNITISLSAHTLVITEPRADSLWTAGDSVTITWSTSGSAGIQAHPMTAYGITPLTGMNGSAGRMNRLRMHHRFRSQRTVGRSVGRTLRSHVTVGETTAELESTTSGIPSIRRDNLRAQHFPQATGGSQIQSDAEVFALNEVTIELLRGGSVIQTIVAGASNSGSYSWTVPATLANSSSYKVRVSCSTDSTVSAESSMFAISDVGSLRVETTPAGALICVDGISRGLSNKNLSRIPVGNHTLTLTRDRCQEWSQTVTIAKNQTLEVEVVLAAGPFSENFNDNTAEFWIQGEGDGRWFVQDGVYKCLGGGSHPVVQISHYNLGKIDNAWTVEAKGLVANAYYPTVVGIMFGVPDDLESGFCFLAMPHESAWAVYKGRSPFGEHTVSPIKNWTRTHDVNAAGWNTLKVEANGKNFRFSINGVLQGMLAIDDIPAQGRLGLITQTASSQDEIQFDDVFLTLTSQSHSMSNPIEMPSNHQGSMLEWLRMPKIFRGRSR